MTSISRKKPMSRGNLGQKDDLAAWRTRSLRSSCVVPSVQCNMLSDNEQLGSLRQTIDTSTMCGRHPWLLERETLTKTTCSSCGKSLPIETYGRFEATMGSLTYRRTPSRWLQEATPRTYSRKPRSPPLVIVTGVCNR